MDQPQLGRLERVELRDIWMSEAANFTPWLARPENLAVLSDTLNIQLQLEAQEKDVGPFRADILCKDIDSNQWVLIENQLELTDHRHLGQLLTYASGLEAVTIIWIAARFTEEHRSTLDWLNRITEESFRFFGLEVELWRIGDSSAAPKFNIVSKPNNWSQSVAQAARAIDEADLSETRLTQMKYWAALSKVLAASGGPVAGNKKPQPQAWMSYPVGRAGFTVNPVMLRQKNQIRAELYISGAHAKAFFKQLKQQKEAVERELGYPLQWEELPTRQDSRISLCLNDVDAENESEWPRQHEWLAKHLNDLHRAFSRRVGALNLDASQNEGETSN
jgi:hypothetical protein